MSATGTTELPYTAASRLHDNVIPRGYALIKFETKDQSMDEEQINIFERGVQLPTHGQWVDVPGSPFQVKTEGHDELGVIWIRVGPDVRPNHWTSWSFMIPDDIEDRD